MRKPILPIRNLDDQLIRDESWENKAYPDPLSPAGLAKAAGKNYLGLDGAPWTIGVGHTGKGVNQDSVWEDDLIQSTFNADIIKAERALAIGVPWAKGELDSTRYYALVNMCFNMGLSRLLGFRKMLAALRDKNWPEAYNQALDSLWAKQTGDRAQRLAKQFRDGIWY